MQGLLPTSFYDRELAPEFSKFSGADLEDLSGVDDQQEHWLYNYALNQLTHPFKPIYRVWAFAHLRRAHSAFDAYHQLRGLLLSYPPYRRAARVYFSALTQAEMCLSFAGQAFQIVSEAMSEAKQPHVNVYATSSDLKQLHDLYVLTKHVHNMVKNHKEAVSVLVWLTPEGLRSRDGLFKFSQLSACMRELAYDARVLSTISDPD